MAAQDQLVPATFAEPKTFGDSRARDSSSLGSEKDAPISQSPLVKQAKSYGVLKSEAAAIWMNRRYIYFIFGCIALAGYFIGRAFHISCIDLYSDRVMQ